MINQEKIPDISDSEVYYKKITDRRDVRGLEIFIIDM